MTTSPDAILIALADEALVEAMRRASTAELLTPILVLRCDAGDTHHYRIVTPGVHPADAMKVLLYGHRATHAAISNEGWAYEQSFDGLDPALVERMRRTGEMPPGHIRPSQHPDRFDVLNLLAQGPGEQTLYRQWRITNGTPRTFTEMTDRAGAELAPSNFWPMFANDDEVRQLTRQYAELQRLRDDIRSRRS